jgi:hypothetical protein
MHCLVKGTLSRQPWFVFCVRWGAGVIARAAMMVHPKASSLLRLGGEKRRRWPRRRRHSESTSLRIDKLLEYRMSLRFLYHAARNKNTIDNSFQHAHCDLRGTRNMASTTCIDRDDGTRCKQCITMQMDSCKARKEWPWPEVGTDLVPSYIAQTSRRHHHHHHHKSWKNTVTSFTILTYKGLLAPAPTAVRLTE